MKTDYKQILKRRARERDLPEHKALDSLGYRNMKAMSDWLRKRAKEGAQPCF